MDSPDTFVTLYSQALFIGWLCTAGVVIWSLHKRAGVELLYLTVLSLALSYILLMYVPPFEMTMGEAVAVTHPHIQATITLSAFLFPLCSKKWELAGCIFLPTAIAVSYLLLFQVPVFTIVGAVLIGGFLSYIYYHSLEWLGAMPDTYILAFAVILPIFTAVLIYPENYFLFLPGLLLGTGVGAAMEQYKVRMRLDAEGRRVRLWTGILGVSGIILLFMGVRPVIEQLPGGEGFSGFLTGLWITFLVPAAAVAGGHPRYGAGEEIIHRSIAEERQ
ncbi:hypothetical protein [Alkalicoccus urumqiensis]|uniref:Uncharacterized protein n=1 Tax=Alkalicoccus urumqiensis TaxID=1548213 RepID=A0A2P6MK93_ALKUR|nr:hypothetical protein [Alkalicoccus urumqiensis]PRO66700.1 hypothetical protein C6I21_01870 [Alkalicoccus urumqiensis]